MVPEPPQGQDPIEPQSVGVSPPPPGFPPPVPPAYYPPPGMMMPFPPPPPPRASRSFARAIFTTLATTVLSVSLLVNIYLGIMVFGGSFSGAGAYTNTIQEGLASEKVAVLTIEGIIGESTAQQVDEWMKGIEQDASVKALVLHVDTPGGSVTASDQIYHRLNQFKSERQLPVAVAMAGLATSGGYYVSCGADQIFAQPTTLTGNIGVLMPRYNISEMAKRYGVQENTLTAPTKGFKNAGSMFQPEDPEETKYLQGIIDSAYARFTGLVQQGRGGKLKGLRSELFDGRVFTATMALESGLIDQIGYLEDAYRWAATKAGLSKPQIVRYQKRPSLLEALSVKSAVPGLAGGGNTVQVNVDARLVEELMTPRLMYLWQGR